MISKLTLKNFQSHKNSELNFSDGVNVIVGPTDSGKSTIIRVLRWVTWNRPSGNEFNSNWGGDTKVVICTNNDQEISRSQDEKGSNKEYKLNTIKDPFRAFGTDVPKEIQEALNFNEINLQSQLDSPFLLTETGGEVAKHFNKIANLDKIDLGQANIKKWVSELESTLKHKNSDLNEEKLKLEKYVDLDKLETDIEVLENLENAITQKKNKQKQLRILIFDISNIAMELEEETKILTIEKTLNQVLSNINSLKEVENNQKKFTRLINSYKNNNDTIAESEELISMEVSLDSLIELYKTKEIHVKDRDRLSKLIKNAKSISTEIKDAEIDYNNLHKQFEDEMGDVCLLCGTKLK